MRKVFFCIALLSVLASSRVEALAKTPEALRNAGVTINDARDFSAKLAPPPIQRRGGRRGCGCV